MKTWETVLRALVREVTVYSTPHLCPILSIRMLSACFFLQLPCWDFNRPTMCSLSLFPVLQYLSLVPIPCVAVLVLGSPETLSLHFLLYHRGLLSCSPCKQKPHWDKYSLGLVIPMTCSLISFVAHSCDITHFCLCVFYSFSSESQMYLW